MGFEKIARREFVRNIAVSGTALGLSGLPLFTSAKSKAEDLKVGIVGLSVHSAAFSKILNDKNRGSDLDGCRITALYHPPGNPDVDFSPEQLRTFEKDVVSMGVKMVDTMDQLIDMVDVVMIETNDGRPHLQESLPAFKAGKPVFIDKPVGANLKEVIEIYEQAEKYNVPVFSSSALRYIDGLKKVNLEAVHSAHTYSPASLEKSHTDLFWYGIHGVELLFSVMGPGCREVMQVHHSPAEDLVIGFWNDGRQGVFRGIREGKRDFGGTVFQQDEIFTLGGFSGYRPLVVKIVEFFLTKKPPVPTEETIEIYSFMEAAQKSKEKGGKRIKIEHSVTT
ncbi:MAG TPA: Gfo/Idh/MocA family oxidoreductase [Cyclobacteriaceae bacterium]|nr:Gfo/Idh/MocA family oxidoreductase [Cyclobacteriaceae bacterium]